MHPSMRLDGTFLRSRLGRRILLMFCIAVIIPATAVFWLTYRTAARNAQQSSQATLRAESKHFAMTIFERLQAAQAMLDHAIAGRGSATTNQALLEPYFTETVWVDARQQAETTLPGLASTLAQQSPELLKSTQLLVLPAVDRARPRVVLLSRPQGTPESRVLAGILRPSFLWGRQEDLAIDGQLCVRAGKQSLACVGDAPRHARAGDLMHDEWELFLKPQFATRSWTIAATKQNPPALASHLKVLAPLAAGLLLLVLLLSSIQIRRILVPLESLMARIRAMSQSPQPFARSTNDDELATLTSTFGEMEHRIRRQMETLRTLSEVDRLILERVPVSLVIDVVVARIQVVADVQAAGVTVSSAGTTEDRRHYVRARGQRQVETGALATLAPLSADAYGPSAGTEEWKTTAVPGSGLEVHGATVVTYLALADRGGTRIWVALGRLPGEDPSEEALAEVRELAERIAVARAVEAHESLLVFQARHDPLTGLPNRLAAVEALTLAIEQTRKTGLEFAAIFIDLDRFKSINDGLGHTLGDRILVQAGERIRQSVGSDDFVARFGGDEFFVILHGIRDAAAAARAMAGITAAFAAPITAEGIELVVGFSAGIALHPNHGADALQLIHNSDVAMYRGKKAGGGRAEFFEEEMNAAALTRVQLENDLRAAIRGGQLQLHYQPRVDSRNGRIVGAEALARWTHPSKGNIPPAVFVTLAEECGLIEELGKFVLDEACRQLGDWQRQGLDLPLVAVNISSHQLRSGRLVDVVSNAVAMAGIRWDELEIEVTESLLVNDSGAAAQQLQVIREAGATVAIDDFGTGYSSLAYLTKLPTDTLKIDRSFFADLQEGGASSSVIRSIIALAEALDKEIVAEGVETMALVEMLSAWGCYVIQGYVYHRPLTVEAMAQELARTADLRSLVAS
ncbi:MAG: EAL domain-containing protein [Luteimonas sp.]|nr:EAL domain-containing protein [Luteimonas sp.]